MFTVIYFRGVFGLPTNTVPLNFGVLLFLDKTFYTLVYYLRALKA